MEVNQENLYLSAKKNHNMKYLFSFIFFLGFQSCFFRQSSIDITDKYLKISSPGQSWYFAEIKPLAMDSVLGYPIDDIAIVNYNIVYRKNNSRIDGNKKVKIYFNRVYKRYRWRYFREYSEYGKLYCDTITLKPFTWYSLGSSNFNYDTYFYWNGKEGDFIIRYRPIHRAW